MRNMSFALTTPQILDQSKDVTRRMGWKHLKAGEIIQPVKKCMGLRPGEAVERLGPPVRALVPRREALNLLTSYPDYGYREVRREGFPTWTPTEFVEMFCDTHRGCTPSTVLTRIEFSYDLLAGWEGMHTAPKDGRDVELLVRHRDWLYASADQKDRWQGPCRGQWLPFNGGGWCWQGHMGEAIAWRWPADQQPAPEGRGNAGEALQALVEWATNGVQGKSNDQQKGGA